jgi:hypothetical protein
MVRGRRHAMHALFKTKKTSGTVLHLTAYKVIYGVRLSGLGSEGEVLSMALNKEEALYLSRQLAAAALEVAEAEAYKEALDER